MQDLGLTPRGDNLNQAQPKKILIFIKALARRRSCFFYAFILE